jgi:hypothetical protein
MAHNMDIDRAENIIDYHFGNGDLLRKALQVAIRRQEPNTGETTFSDDGNRRLAQLGHKVLELVLLDSWYRTGGDRGKYSSTTQDRVSLTNISRGGQHHLGSKCCERFSGGCRPAIWAGRLHDTLGAATKSGHAASDT